MQVGDVSSIEIYKTLQEVDIKNQSKTKLNKARKEGNKGRQRNFLRKIAITSGIQGVNAMYTMKRFPPTMIFD